LPDGWESGIRRVAVIASIFQGGLWVSAALDGWLADYRRRRIKDDAAAVTTVAALAFLGRVALWSIIFLLVLDNFGIDVTALVAGLGIGGIAIALAAQNILGDLFASMSIVLDKPFVLGDFIAAGEEKGTVEHIGLKSTRVRGLTGEQIVFSNADLLSSRLRNFGRMRERRITFGVSTTYQTSREQLERIPTILREAVEAAAGVRFDRAHFKSLGALALDFEVVYYVTVPDYAQYMDIQQGINLRVFERFHAEGIPFAYSAQRFVLESVARP
jgi:small-conductance mechanosensitive channel